MIMEQVSGLWVQVLIGGGENHRMGLYDMVMVKDNHIAVAGGIKQAIQAVENYLTSKNLDIGVEVLHILCLGVNTKTLLNLSLRGV